MNIGKAISFNPTESIKKGSIAKKIPMASLSEFQRNINSYELSNYNSGPKFRNGDTLLSKITPCLENGKTAYVDILEDDEVAFGSSEFIVLRETEYTDREYVYYLAISPTFRKRAISCMEGTSGRKRVNENTLKYFELPFPDKFEQKQIAKVLSDLDAKIDLNNKINQELEALAKTIYDYWFVQFDFPYVSSSAVENDPQAHLVGKPYKSSGGKMVYNVELKRDIPEGWESYNLGDIGKVSMCKRIMKHETSEDQEIPFYKISTFGKNPETFISKELFESYREKYSYPKKGDILISAAGTIGKTVIFDGEPSYFQDSNIVWVDNDESKISNGFLYYYYQKEPWIVTGGSTIKRLYNENIRSLKICRPDSKLLDEFTKLVDSTLRKQGYIKKENQKLAALRDWLLPMLMNGQVTVGKAKEQLGMVAEEKII